MLFGLSTQAAVPRAGPETPAVASFLDLYDRGDYAAVIRGLEQVAEPRNLERLDSDLHRTAKTWIEAAPPDQRIRRGFVAGALALELTHALTVRETWLTVLARRNAVLIPESLPALARLIARAPGSADPLHHDWVLASLATWQEWDSPARMAGGDSRVTPEPAWAVLLGGPRLIDHAKAQDAVGAGGFLGQALQRFPDDPRLRLAELEGHEAIETRCADQLCHDEMTPAALEDLHTRANAPGPTNESVGCKDRCWVFALLRSIHDSAVVNLRLFDRLLPVAAEFAKLASRYPAVRAEADVHIGYLAIRAARPDAALGPLAAAATSEDPYVHYLAEHFTGRALEMMGRRGDAIAAYRRALAIVHDAPSTATLLASQLFLSDDAGDREEAHAVLEASLTASPRPVDPWNLYWQGDARRWSLYMERLRQDLRP
jgi:hypothetical protein